MHKPKVTHIFVCSKHLDDSCCGQAILVPYKDIENEGMISYGQFWICLYMSKCPNKTQVAISFDSAKEE